MDKSLVKKLRKGLEVRTTFHGIESIFSPVDPKKVGVKDSVIRVGDRVLCYERGELKSTVLQEMEVRNRLPRFRLESKKWVGKTKILAKIMPILDNAATAIDDMGDRFFLTCEPNVLDFTNLDKGAKIVLISKTSRIEIPMPKDRLGATLAISGLDSFLTRPEKVIIGWNIKPIITYMRGRSEAMKTDGEDPVNGWDVRGKVFDLKLLESYLGIDLPCPQTYLEAGGRLSQVFKHPSWKTLQKIYKEVYMPLMLDVLPSMEIAGLNHTELGMRVHPCYEIEGQANGRMRCDPRAFTRGFNPHSLGADEKVALRALTYDKCFLYLDYHHMEVTMLQYLSGDQRLKHILDSGQDIYCGIWEQITTLPCDEKFRKVCKNLFLPVVYGQGIKSVADRAKVSETTAKKLVDRIYSMFGTALSWAKEQQSNLDAQNFVTDYFQRRRKFEEKQYRIRNFAVQAPAAIVCLHKLVKLHEALSSEKLRKVAHLILHLHDGYVIMCSEKSWRKVRDRATEVLEADEELYPGLPLTVSCHKGANLNEMMPV